MTEAAEFWKIYELDVVSIPTNRPLEPPDQGDLVYIERRRSGKAIVDEIERSTSRLWQQAPCWIGTISVDNSEKLSRMLQKRGVHEVLNAKDGPTTRARRRSCAQAASARP